jgi:hypothetical protein
MDKTIDLWINEAKDALNKSSDGELPLRDRRALYRLIGSTDEDAKKTRAKLALLCARKVEPIWFRRWPNDDLPMRLNELSYQVIQELSAAGSLETVIGVSRQRLDDRLGEGPNLDATYAGFSALAAALATLYDEQMDDPGNEDEGQIDPQEWDAAFYAALAESGGAKWESQSDRDKRRSFWLWYLTVALPSALEHS